MLKDDPDCKFLKNVNKLYSMQSSHFLMVWYLINGNLVLCILVLQLNPCTLCNTYSICVLLLSELTFAASSAQENDIHLSEVVEAILHYKLETMRFALLLSAGA